MFIFFSLDVHKSFSTPCNNYIFHYKQRTLWNLPTMLQNKLLLLKDLTVHFLNTLCINTTSVHMYQLQPNLSCTCFCECSSKCQEKGD